MIFVNGICAARRPSYQSIIALAHVRPLPNTTSSTLSPGPNRPCGGLRPARWPPPPRRCCRRRQVEEKFLLRHLQPVGDGVDDAEIRLVRDDAGDVVDGQSGAFERLHAGAGHGADRLFERLLAQHLDRVETLIEIFLGDRTARPAARARRGCSRSRRRWPCSVVRTPRAATLPAAVRAPPPPRRRRRARRCSGPTNPPWR